MKNRLLALFGITIAILFVIRFMSMRREGFTNATGSGADMFTLYYVDWCPHCKTVKPMFEEFAKNGFVTIAGKNVQVRAIECEKQAKEAEGKPIKGYPTFLLETAEGKTVEYQGDRSPEGWLKFLEEQLSAGSAHVA
jgi:thiol-disulfide isomerase/thioredoxin